MIFFKTNKATSVMLVATTLLSTTIGLSLLSTGCGGAKSGPVSSTSAPQGQGSVRMKIAWPDPSRIIPRSATRIRMRILKGTTEIATGEVNRPQSEIIINDIPTGDYVIAVEGYRDEFNMPSSPSTPVATQKAFIPVTIKAAQISPVKIELESTIDRIEITREDLIDSLNGSETSVLGPTTSFSLNEEVFLFATAYNKDSAVVPISEESIIFEIEGGAEQLSDFVYYNKILVQARTLTPGTIRARVSDRETGAKMVSFTSKYTVDKPEYIIRERIALLPSLDNTRRNQSFISAGDNTCVVTFANRFDGISTDGTQTVYAGIKLFNAESILFASYDYPASDTDSANVVLRAAVLLPSFGFSSEPSAIAVLKSNPLLPQGDPEREKLQFFQQSTDNFSKLELIREVDGSQYVGLARSISASTVFAFKSNGEVETLDLGGVNQYPSISVPPSLRSAQAFAVGTTRTGNSFYAAANDRIVRFGTDGIDSSFDVVLQPPGAVSLDVYRGLVYVVPIGSNGPIRVYNSKGTLVNEINSLLLGSPSQPLAISVGMRGLSSRESLLLVDNLDPLGQLGGVVKRLIRTR